MVILNLKVQILFHLFPKLLSCTHPSGSQTYATRLDQNLKGERGGELTTQ